MKKLIFIIFLFPLFTMGQVVPFGFMGTEEGDTFPPAGTVITNGGFDTDTNWTKQNGSTISGGVATVVGNGGVNVTFSNWSLRQNSIFATDGTTTYTVKFKARVTSGTGNLQMSRNYYTPIPFNQTITSSWVDYEFTMPASSTSTYDDLVIGGLTVSDTFEIDEISAVAD